MKVRVTAPEFLDRARQIADHLGAELIPDNEEGYSEEKALRMNERGEAASKRGANDRSGKSNGAQSGKDNTADRYLRFDGEGLTLVQGKMELRGDFRQMISRISGGHLQHEKLLRAVKFREEISDPLAVDATAGLGEDSFILAAGGFSVIMCEYNPVIAALLGDALERAREDPDIGEIARRMKLVEGDSIEILRSLERAPDIIYLDPMFPAKKKSGISTKKLQLFQTLETPCADEEELLGAAFAANPRRIVVKRPIKGAPLAGKKAGYSIDCRNVRYDCHVVRG